LLGYAPGAFDLFHIGHLNLLREARSRCDFLIAGVVADDILIARKGIRPVIPLSERLEIVRNIRCVDAALPATTNGRVESGGSFASMSSSREKTSAAPKRVIAWNGISRPSESRSYTSRTPRRHRAGRSGVRCRISAPSLPGGAGLKRSLPQIQAGGRRLLEGAPVRRPDHSCVSAPNEGNRSRQPTLAPALGITRRFSRQFRAPSEPDFQKTGGGDVLQAG
jgi:cytidyltransferase-like protein